jgi:hypothetical protein
VNKLKRTEIAKEARKRGFLEVVRSSAVPSPSVDQALWETVIKDLTSRRFASVEEAVAVIADQVCQRLALEESAVPGVRLFVTDMLESDPAIREELQALLDIR